MKQRNPDIYPPLTEVAFSFPDPFPLNPDTTLLASIGSCFSVHLADVLSSSGIVCSQNPGGILYNPSSIARILTRCLADIPFAEHDFFEYGGRFHCFELHGEFSGRDCRECVLRAEHRRKEFSAHLKQTDLLLVTFGSAVVFESVETGKIVANCHKLPGTCFRRRILSADECRASMEAIVTGMRDFNPDCRILFSISPVRHNPGDLILNARSKAALLTALHETMDRHPEVLYFPAFEILTDELRDYRFYREDMLHPADVAVDLIVRKFAYACFGASGLERVARAERVRRTTCHIPFDTGRSES